MILSIGQEVIVNKLLMALPLLIGLAFAQTQAPKPPLVECVAGKNLPCVVLATKTSDMAGIWKQYQSNPAFAPLGGMGYIRYNSDGTFVIADTLENTAAPHKPFPYGKFGFDGSRMTIQVQNPPPTMPECARSVQEVRVIHLGDALVGLSFTPLEDTCKPRLDSIAQVQIYVGAAR